MSALVKIFLPPAVFCIIAVAIIISSSHLPPSRYQVFGAKAYPILIGSILIISSILAAIESYRKRVGEGNEAQDSISSVTALMFFIVMTGLYICGMTVLGYYTATCIYTPVIILFLSKIFYGPLDRKTFVRSIIMSCFIIALLFGMAKGFKLYLPSGILWQ